MNGLASLVRQGVDLLLLPFDLLPRRLGLFLFSVVSGLLMLLVVGKATPQGRLKYAREQMTSSIYELRLFLDSPRRIFSAQARLVLWSLNYLAYLLPAFALLMPALAVLYAPLEMRYGLRSLRAEESALVRIDLRAPAPSVEQATVEGGAAVRLAAPPVLVPEERVLYLRLDIVEPGLHSLRIQAPGWQVEKRITADARGEAVVSAERRSGIFHLLAVGNEAPLPGDSPVAGISVAHAARTQSWLGLEMPWWVAWLIIATLVALAFRRRFGVTL